MEPIHGILNIDKPAGLGSTRVVSMIKRLFPRGTKVGHAGTLDSFATGVLLVLVGKATKQCESLMDEPKQYVATVKLGATTETDDPTKPPAPWPGAIMPAADDVREALATMVGDVRQRPPAFSALKISGRRASDFARVGQAPPVKERIVRIDAIELMSFDPPDAIIRVDCGRGTYIRAIARDLGEALHCGGYLTQLRRTRVGLFVADNGVSPAELSAATIQPFLQQRKIESFPQAGPLL